MSRVKFVLFVFLNSFGVVEYLLITASIDSKHYLECILSYGENCRYPCSEHCINQTCDRRNGSCQYGCEHGEQCDGGIFILNFGMVSAYGLYNLSTWLYEI